MIRFGLCCQFLEHPVTYKTTTARHLLTLDESSRTEKLSALCLHNSRMLKASLEYCADHGIRAFRVQSQIFPLKTHADCGYDVRELPDGSRIIDVLRDCGAFAAARDIRLSFHPDQFVVLNSPSDDVVARSIEDLDYQAEVAEWIGADTINIHGGGAYGDKAGALKRFVSNLNLLPRRVRARLTVENDDKIYTPRDLLGLCLDHGVPLVYDVHHHRCLPDDLSVEEATRESVRTWGGREPLFHISSPKDGWKGPEPLRHHDYIDPADFPACWSELAITVEVEAKAKELAVLKLIKDMGLRR